MILGRFRSKKIPNSWDAFHLSKNSRIVGTGAKGNEISLERFRKIRKLSNFRNQTSQPKIPEVLGETSNGTEISEICPNVAENRPEQPENNAPFVT